MKFTSIKKILLICLVIAFVPQVFGQTSKEWLQLRSKNFFLIGDASEKDLIKSATKLEQFHEMFKMMFPSASLKASIPTNVVVFKNKNSYKPFLPRRNDGKADTGIAGYFQPGPDVNYITFSTEGEDDDVFGTIFHEYVHFIVNTNFGKSTIPPWFNEGLAEYYQTFKVEKDIEIHLGRHQDGHIHLLRSTKMFPLKDLFAVNNYSLHQNGNHSRSIFYAQSWALIHYLIREGKAESLDKFLQATLINKPQEQAFVESFGMSYEQMEKELRKYVERNAYQYSVYQLKKKFELDASIRVSPLSESMANAYLGDLLMHSNRSGDAELYLKHSLSLDPNNSLANTAMGTAMISQRKFDAAKAYLDKAVAGDVENHLAYYQYAFLLSKSGMDEFGYVTSFDKATAARMREMLKKAISLKPDFTESYEMMAFLSLVNNEEIDEAINMLKIALNYQPGNQQYAIRIAELLSRQQKLGDAKALAEKLERTTDDPGIKSRAQGLLNQIGQLEKISAINAANEANIKKMMEERGSSGGTGPVFIRRSEMELTAEEKASVDRAEMRAINLNLRTPAENEKRLVGTIDKITCDKGKVAYHVTSPTGKAMMTSENFADLAVRALFVDVGETNVGCDVSLAKFKTVVTYTDELPGTGFTGRVVGVEFVPDHFQLLTPAEMEEDDDIVIAKNAEDAQRIVREQQERYEKNPPPDVAKSMEDQRREFMLNNIKNNLAKPGAGELQTIGTVRGFECSKKGMIVLADANGKQLRLLLDSNNPPKMMGYTPDAAGFRVECGMKPIELNFVITFADQPDKKAKSDGRLIALEAVPKSFTL